MSSAFRALEYLTLLDGLDPTKHFLQLYQDAHHDMEKVELLNIATLLKEKKGCFCSQQTLSPNVQSA